MMAARSRATGLRGLISAVLPLASVALAGCGRAEPARQPELALIETRAKETTRSMTPIEIVSGSHRWQVRLVDSPSARDFLSQLPLKLPLRDYAGTEKIADLPRKLTREGAPAAITPVKGDVTFYAPWGNLAIFYKDGHHSPGLIPLGRIEGDLGDLANANSEVLIRRYAAN